MQRRYIDTEFVKLAEEKALRLTHTAFGDTDVGLNFVHDTWLKVQHFTGECEDISSDQGSFQFYAYFQCLQSPYTLINAYQLWRRANYVEAAILLRHLLEVFVQLRYFQAHPELCMGHVNERPKGRVRFQTMFDELAPGLYDVAYRKLSKIAHGNLTMGFRADLPKAVSKGSEYVVPVLAPAQFDRGLAMIVNSFYTIITLGFLNYYPRFFPKNTIATDATLVKDFAKALEWVTSVFEFYRQNVESPRIFNAAERLVFP